ncbi:MAG: ABC transporter permease, partial [Lachnospiraceae bacterium]|nr:ABC transporter permease [Lachnospiraceae bacterium]
MWKEYSLSYIKRNKASSISVIAASLIATLFLSLLCSLFFNLWVYETESIIADEGDWHGRLVVSADILELATIEKFSNVERAMINHELSNGQTITVDIVFRNPRATYEDMPLLAEYM